jgi:CrcB protein
LAILLVNIVGSAMMGGLAGLVNASVILPEAWRSFFAVGSLGALATSSSFAFDTGAIWQKQEILIAGAYVMVSVILSLLAFGVASWMVKHSGIWQ